MRSDFTDRTIISNSTGYVKWFSRKSANVNRFEAALVVNENSSRCGSFSLAEALEGTVPAISLPEDSDDLRLALPREQSRAEHGCATCSAPFSVCLRSVSLPDASHRPCYRRNSEWCLHFRFGGNPLVLGAGETDSSFSRPPETSQQAERKARISWLSCRSPPHA